MVSCPDAVSRWLKIAKFPVKFPDSREFAWRRERLALRRQPASPKDGGGTPQRAEKPAVGGLLQFGAGSLNSQFTKREANSAKVSGDYRKYSHFWETRAGDPIRSPLRAKGGIAVG
jgi:hypothetical protein